MFSYLNLQITGGLEPPQLPPPSKDAPVMAIRVVEFSNGGYKIGKIFAKESTYSKEIIEF